MIESSRGEEIGGTMLITDYTKPELDYFRETCNFVGFEKPLFELRSQGVSLEEIAEILNTSAPNIGRISQRVNKKIKKVL